MHTYKCEYIYTGIYAGIYTETFSAHKKKWNSSDTANDTLFFEQYY